MTLLPALRLAAALVAFVALASPATRAQTAPKALPTPTFDQVQSPEYGLSYQVPTTWHQLRQGTDTTVALTYLSPDESLMLFVIKMRNAADRYTPAQALYHLTEKFNVPLNKQYSTRYHQLDFLETTGSGRIDGRELRYDALATRHQGHLLLLYVLATPDAFLTHEPELLQVLHSFAPYKAPRPAKAR